MKYLRLRYLSRVIFLMLIFLDACEDKTRNFQYEEKDIVFLQEGYRKGEFTIQEVVSSYLDRIEAIDKKGPQLNSIVEINPDALAIAKALDEEMKSGKSRGPLHGIPVILKDNIDTHDQMSTTAGSRALKGSHPLQDSWVTKQLRDAGAVIIAKANLSEWANFRGNLSSSGWSGVGGQTKNPYMLSRNPCGSSAGSGASVSANLSMISIGTETNGSIVCPSNNNGVVGIKPTVGLLSRSGIIPISFTQDTPGPMTRSVRDAAICLGVLAAADPSDSKTLDTTRKAYSDYTVFLKDNGLKGKRIGLFTGALGRNYKVDKLMNTAVDYLKSQGAEIINIDQITKTNAGEMSFKVLLYEFKDGLNKYFQSLGPNAPVKSLEELIAFNKTDSVELRYYDQKTLESAQEKGDLQSQEYKEALSGMLKAMRDEGIDRVMNENHLDAIIAPTGGPAWKIDLINGDRGSLGSSSFAAISGYPNITVPMGFIDGLPSNISFFGRAWSEPILLEIAYSYEQGTRHRQAPKFLP